MTNPLMRTGLSIMADFLPNQLQSARAPRSGIADVHCYAAFVQPLMAKTGRLGNSLKYLVMPCFKYLEAQMRGTGKKTYESLTNSENQVKRCPE